MEQDIRFCTTSDGARIAYARSGQGPPLVKAANWLTHLEYDWKSPLWQAWLEGLGRHRTLIRYDERGCGLSDWDVSDFSFDAWVDDLEAVVEASELDRFALLGISQGGPIAMTYAARHPERVTHLVLYGTYVRGRLKRDPTPRDFEEAETLDKVVRLGWGQENPAFRQIFTSLFLPDGTPEQVQAFNELQRISTSPENAARIIAGFNIINVEELAPKIDIPTLVLHARKDARIPFEEGRRVASLIPGARFVPLDSNNHLLLEQEPAWPHFLREVLSFLGVAPDEISSTLESPRVASSDSRERFRRADEIFDAALDVAPAQRSEWLAEMCGSDDALRKKVERLLSLSEGGEDALATGQRGAASLWEEAARDVQSVSAEPRLSPGERLGAYEIVDVLGSGGMGTVYRAKHPELEREVAVKALSEVFRSDPSRLQRFRREAKLLAALDHPNIATIHDLLVVDDQPFLILELVEGEGLDELIARGPTDTERVVSITVQIAEALQEAHRKGVVHRDLKPSNIKIRSDGRVKVLDFGLAKSVAPEAVGGSFTTRSDMVLGTPSYMSPEQARGEPVDERADIWALGCVVFEMLAGRPPFEGKSPLEVISAILRDPVPSLPADARYSSAVGGKLHAVIDRCLQKDADARYPSVGELIADLSAPTGHLGETESAIRRRRSVRVGLGLLGLALVIILALLLR